MLDKIMRIFMSVILIAAVLVGAYLGFQRYQVESNSKTVELAMDYNDLKTLSSISNYSLDKLLKDVKDRGIVSIGVREETLPEANTMGELQYISGSGILRSPEINPTFQSLAKRKLIAGNKVYIYSNIEDVRKRVQNQIHLLLPSEKFKNIGKTVFAIDEGDVLLSDAGIGMSEAVNKYLTKKGFRIIPRIWNDRRYEVVGKIGSLKGYDTIIFDGDEITGYPDNITLMGKAMKNAHMRFGNVEIVKQDGDTKLKRIMDRDIVRVNSIAKDELKKIDKDEAVTRFVRAARERNIRLMYIRPFMPPQITEDPIKYNLNYLSEIKKGLESAKFNLGKASAPKNLDPFGWEIVLLGTGVVVGMILLINYFIVIPAWLMFIIIIASELGMVFIGVGTKGYLIEKYMAFLAAVTFPSFAVISQFYLEKPQGRSIILDSSYMVLNVLTETAIGIILIIGLLANTSFMLASQTFIGIKFALILPVIIVAAFFFFKTESGFDINALKTKTMNILNTVLPVWVFLSIMAALAVAAVFLARSGNFVLPVPGFEKVFRIILEQLMYIRPRTKEFLIGYPILMLASYFFIKKINLSWMPVLLAIGTIGPVSFLNTFCHIHTPIMVSVIRSMNGIVLGLLIGWLVCFIYSKFSKA